MPGFDLDGYFARIGYGGPARADLETLTAIHAAHVASIPFENLDPLLGRPVRLDLESLQAKLVQSRRGGYCFELNALLRGALEALGFQVTGLIARVRWGAAADAPLGGRNHMLMKVDIADGPYLVDVGFGAHLLDAPLRLEPGVQQATPWASYRLTEAGGALSLSASVAGEWRAAYLFNLEPVEDADYETSNWFTSTHPQSLFVSYLVCERLTHMARYNLVNTRLVERRRDGGVLGCWAARMNWARRWRASSASSRRPRRRRCSPRSTRPHRPRAACRRPIPRRLRWRSVRFGSGMVGRLALC